jgi:rhamnosyl/mannosyltransferase
MRVLHFYKTCMPESLGGTERFIDQLARSSLKLGVETDVLALANRPTSARESFNGYSLNFAKRNFEIASTGFSFGSISLLKKLAAQADVIHYHFPWPFMDLVHFLSRPKKPCVVTYHSDIIRQKNLLKFYRPLKHLFLRSVDRIVATSPNYLATSDVLKQYSHKVDVIPIGLDQDTYAAPSSEKKAYWRNKIGDRFFLFVGAIRYYKGLHILVEAARGTDYPIVIVGAGPIERELKQQAVTLGLRNIYFLGYLPDEDRAALLELCHCVIFPSHLRSEAFGISLLEGAMHGKPLISSEIGTGTTFINISRETGLVVPPNDPAALRNAMQYVWEHPEQAAEMGSRAAARYRQLFTADQMASAYVDVYKVLIQSHSSNALNK